MLIAWVGVSRPTVHLLLLTMQYRLCEDSRGLFSPQPALFLVTFYFLHISKAAQLSLRTPTYFHCQMGTCIYLRGSARICAKEAKLLDALNLWN